MREEKQKMELDPYEKSPSYRQTIHLMGVP